MKEAIRCSVMCLLWSLLSFGYGDEFCLTNRRGQVCQDHADIKLTRLSGKQDFGLNIKHFKFSYWPKVEELSVIGEEEELEIDNDNTLFVKTISHKPLILEIPQFLTPEECAHFINVAKEEGLKSSETTQNSGKKDSRFMILDVDKDKQLSVEEMRLSIEQGTDTYLDEADILQMYKDVNLDTNNDSFITPKELQNFSPNDLQEYLKNFLQKHPEKHSRYSKQVWLFPDKSSDDVFTRIQNRVSQVTSLPLELIKISDFQVVSYGVKGHYNAHFDSSTVNKKIPCCTRQRTQNCRICRYLTMLFYLNDVEEGGETAFPVAGNDTADMKQVQTDRLIDLYRKCEDSKLRVPPEAGKAILWYNHFIDPQTGWMGEMDNFTFHGGCSVKRGTKWIANFWIKTTDDKLRDLKMMKKYSATKAKVKEEL